LVLGSLYFQYSITLSKPTIQPQFVGTSSIWSQPSSVSTGLTAGAAPSFVAGALDAYGVAQNLLVGDARNNDGSLGQVYSSPNWGDNTVWYPPGVYNQAFTCTCVGGGWTLPTSSYLGASVSFSVYADTTATGNSAVGSWLPSNVSSVAINNTFAISPTITGPPTTAMLRGYTVFAQSLSTFTVAINFGWRLVVPEGPGYYLAINMIAQNQATGGATIALSGQTITSSSAFPLPGERILFAPTTLSLLDRIGLLEGVVESKSALTPGRLGKPSGRPCAPPDDDDVCREFAEFLKGQRGRRAARSPSPPSECDSDELKESHLFAQFEADRRGRLGRTHHPAPATLSVPDEDSKRPAKLPSNK